MNRKTRIRLQGDKPYASMSQSAEIAGAEISHDGRVVVSLNTANKVNIYDMNTKRCTFIIKADDTEITAYKLTRDAQLLLVGCANGTLIVYRIRDCRMLAGIPAHDRAIRTIDVSIDGEICVTAGDEGKIAAWSLALLIKSRLPQNLRTLEGHEARVTRIKLAPDCQTLLSADRNGILKVWDLQSGVCKETLEIRPAPVTALDIGSAGTVALCAARAETISQWVMGGAEMQPTVYDLRRPVLSAELSFDMDYIAASCSDGFIRFVSVPSKETVYEINLGVPDSVAVMSRDGQYIVFHHKENLYVRTLQWAYDYKLSSGCPVQPEQYIRGFVKMKAGLGGRKRVKISAHDMDLLTQDLAYAGFQGMGRREVQAVIKTILRAKSG